MRTPSLFETAPRFDGPVFDPALDQARLTKQLGRVFDLMRDGHWRTLQEIADATGDPHASISAQLRHLRKPRFGSHLVEKQRRGYGGTWEYRLVPNADGPDGKATRRPTSRSKDAAIWLEREADTAARDLARCMGWSWLTGNSLADVSCAFQRFGALALALETGRPSPRVVESNRQGAA